MKTTKRLPTLTLGQVALRRHGDTEKRRKSKERRTKTRCQQDPLTSTKGALLASVSPWCLFFAGTPSCYDRRRPSEERTNHTAKTPTTRRGCNHASSEDDARSNPIAIRGFAQHVLSDVAWPTDRAIHADHRHRPSRPPLLPCHVRKNLSVFGQDGVPKSRASHPILPLIRRERRPAPCNGGIR